MTDWETRYYEAEALHTEANGMLTAENERLRRALSDVTNKLRDEEERHAALQARCFEGFPSATDGIFQAYETAKPWADCWNRFVALPAGQRVQELQRRASYAVQQRDALERARGCIKGLLARTPVRDVSETLAEIDAALGAGLSGEVAGSSSRIAGSDGTTGEPSGKPEPSPEGVTGTHLEFETNSNLLRTIRDHPASNVADCTVGKTTLAKMIDDELRHQSCTKSRRQIVFDWVMGEEAGGPNTGWWGTSEAVAHVDELLAALDKCVHQVGRDVWRPIASAPEHEDVLIAQVPSPMVWAAYRIEDEWYFPGDDQSFSVQPTHWMPLPAAPDSTPTKE